MKIILSSIIFFFSISLFAQENKVVVPRDTSFALYTTYIKEAKKRPYIKMVKPNLPEGVEAFENVGYSFPYEGRALVVNVYRPKDKKKYPALLMVHGGGWNSGNLTLQIPMAQAIASKGYVAIPVEYRLSPEAGYPSGVYDLKTAVRWMKANADKYGIDTTRIAISGCSAGGQLAGLIGATNGQPQFEDRKEYANHSSTVQAVINIDGISDFTVEEALEDVRATLAKGKVSASVKWFGGTIEEKPDDWKAASSVFWVTPQSAPICFINSSIDRFHQGRDEIIEKLSAYNIYTEVHSIPDTPHPFWLFEPWFDTTVGYMTAYLDKMFK